MGFRGQAILHILLLAAALSFLPIAIPASPNAAAGSAGSGPALWLFGVLVAGAGLPFFAVAATAPLLQRWFSLGGHAGSRDPYFLYAASNAGSLLGLLALSLGHRTLADPVAPGPGVDRSGLRRLPR